MIAYSERPLVATVDLSAPGVSARGAFRGVGRALLLLAALYAAGSAVAIGAATIIPDSTERSWFGRPDISELTGDARVFAEIALQRKPRGSDRAEKVLDRLLEPGGLRALRYDITVVSDGGPNAWARPGGRIFVSSALLNAIGTEVGLATVIAHELGHHERRHILGRMARALFLQMPVQAVLGRLRLRAGEEGARFAELSHERDEETEADEFALERVHLAYGRLDGALEFFEYVAKLEPRSPGAARFLRTHPLSAERLEHLHALQRSLSRNVVR